MTVDDNQFRALIEQARNANVSLPERRKALNRLLIKVQHLPGILRSSHQDYELVLNEKMEILCKKLSEFDEDRSSSLERSLVNWLNGYLKWGIKDLYIQAHKKQRTERSLDEAIKQGEESAGTLKDQLSDPIPSLNTLDGYIQAEQAKHQQRRGQWVEQYIEQDPDSRLANCHPRNNSDCNCQILAQRILLKDPPERITTLAREFNINQQTLFSHWKKKCLPLLREIANRYTELP